MLNIRQVRGRRRIRLETTAPVPRYRQVAAQLREAIQAGEYAPGSLLPSEPQLAATFGLSRPTVHQAIGLLRTEGLVEVKHGKGTFVAQRPTLQRLGRMRQSRAFRETGRGAFDAEMKALGLSSRSEVVQVGPVTPPADAAERLGLEGEERALIRRRQMYADDRPIQLATSYLPWSLAEGTQMTQVDTGPGGTYSRLADIGHTPARFTEDVGTRLPTSEESAFLQIAPGQPVFNVVRTAYNAEGRPVEVNYMVIAGDRWQLCYDWDAD